MRKAAARRTVRRIALVGLLLSAVTLCLAPPAQAQLTVACDEDPAARAAALVAAVAASVGSGERTVALEPGCVYTLRDPAAPPNGLPVVAAGSDLSIEGNGATIVRDPNAPPFRFLEVADGARLTLRMLTLRGGRTPDGTDGEDAPGGGAIAALGDLVLDGCLLIGNETGAGGTAARGGNGGAVYSTGALHVTDSSLSGNACGAGGPGGNGGGGGAIYHEGPIEGPPDAATLVLEGTGVSGNVTGPPGPGLRPNGTSPRSGRGGGIYALAHVLLRHASIVGNRTADGGSDGAAGWGGGIHHAFGSLTVEDSVIARNATGRGGFGDGGGVYLNVTTLEAPHRAAFVRTQIVDNVAGDGADSTAEEGAGASGGGIFLVNSILELSDSVLRGNRAGSGRLRGGSGGAIHGFGTGRTEDDVDTSTIRILRTTIEGNEAGHALGGGVPVAGSGKGGEGGGVYNGPFSTLEVVQSTLAENFAGDGGSGAGTAGGPGGHGGAIANHGELDVRNSTIARNVAGDGAMSVGGGIGLGGRGGGLFLGLDATAVLASVTFADNYGGFSGSGAPAAEGALFTVSGAVARATNTVFRATRFPTPRAPNGDCSAGLVDEGGNLQWGAHCGATIAVGDPLLAPLADNGGPTATMALRPGSAALDAGNPATCPDVDQRGVPRPAGACDAGAFERVAGPGGGRLIPVRPDRGELPVYR